jgi:hypothetical protein
MHGLPLANALRENFFLSWCFFALVSNSAEYCKKLLWPHCSDYRLMVYFVNMYFMQPVNIP